MTTLTAPDPVSPPDAPPGPGKKTTADRVAAVRSLLGAGITVSTRGLHQASSKAMIFCRPVTVLGWVTLAAAAVLFLLAQSGGWEEFGVAAVCLAAALVVAMAFTVGRSHYSRTGSAHPSRRRW
jgi:hypothetical protein